MGGLVCWWNSPHSTWQSKGLSRSCTAQGDLCWLGTPPCILCCQDTVPIRGCFVLEAQQHTLPE